MEKSKLYELLLSFSASEWRQLAKVLDSPFFSLREDVRRLYDFLKSQFGQGHVPDREAAFEAAYPGQAFDFARLRHLMSFLFQQVEQVLIQSELKKDEALKNILLLRALEGRRVKKVYRSTLNKQSRLLASIPLRNTDHHLNRIENLRTEMGSSDNRTEKLQEQFQQLSGEVDVFFILHKLQLACAALTHQRMFKVEYELGMLTEVLAHIHEHNLLALPEVAICYDCYMMLAEPGEEAHFHQLKARLPQAQTYFEATEARTFYTHLINFCISRINQSNGEYLRQVFEIYRLGIHSEMLLENGQLSPYTYKNIVSAAIKLGEFIWAEQFIEDYAETLPKEMRRDFHAYNLARLHLANGQWAKVIRILNQLYIQDPFTNLDGRIILIKACFELEDIKQTEYHLSNLQHHLRRKEYMTYHKKNYLAFVSFTRRLLNLPPFAAAQRQQLAEEMRAATWLTERDWLLAKINKH